MVSTTKEVCRNNERMKISREFRQIQTKLSYSLDQSLTVSFTERGEKVHHSEFNPNTSSQCFKSLLDRQIFCYHIFSADFCFKRLFKPFLEKGHIVPNTACQALLEKNCYSHHMFSAESDSFKRCFQLFFNTFLNIHITS